MSSRVISRVEIDNVGLQCREIAEFLRSHPDPLKTQSFGLLGGGGHPWASRLIRLWRFIEVRAYRAEQAGEAALCEVLLGLRKSISAAVGLAAAQRDSFEFWTPLREHRNRNPETFLKNLEVLREELLKVEERLIAAVFSQANTAPQMVDSPSPSIVTESPTTVASSVAGSTGSPPTASIECGGQPPRGTPPAPTASATGGAMELELPPAVKEVACLAETAMKKEPRLMDATDQELYDWIKSHLLDDNQRRDFHTPATFTRYLREWRKATGTQKSISREGRAGRSIVNSDDL